MEFFTNDVIRELLAHSLETASLKGGSWTDTGAGPGFRTGEFVEWLTIRNQAQSVRDDVSRVRCIAY